MIIVFYLFALFILLEQFRKAHNLGIIIVFTASFIIKIVVLILSEYEIITLIDGGGDALGFQKETLYCYNKFSFLELLEFWNIQSTFGTFPIICAIVLKIIGPYPLSILIINFLLHNQLLLIFGSFFRLINSSNIVFYFVFFLIGAYPIYLSYSVLFLREMYFSFVVALTTYNLIFYTMFSKFKNQIYLIIVLNLIAIILHPGFAVFFLYTVLYITYKRKKLLSAPILFLYLLLIALSYVIFNNGYGGGYLDFLFTTEDIDQSVLELLESAREGSVFHYKKFYSTNLFQNIFIAFPIDVANFLFSPTPFAFKNIYYYGLFRYPTGIITIVIFLIIIIRYRKMDKNFRWLILLFLISILPYVFGTGDVIQAVRHKMKFYPILLLLLPFIYNSKFSKR
jgi:hypothetical protein